MDTKIFWGFISNKWFLLVINMFFFIAAAFYLPIRYEENDDVTMSWIASGFITGKPEYHLVFINAIYGYALMLFYMLNIGIEWYAVFFAIIHVFSVTAIEWVLLEKIEVNKYLKLFFILLLYVIWLSLILLFQFTTTSCLAAFAALILIYYNRNIEGLVFFIIASMLRFHAAMLVGLLMSPFFIALYGVKLRKYVILIIVLTCSLGVRYADTLFYEDEWIEYKVYNDLRGRINDNPNADKILSLPEGISWNDYELLVSFMGDPNIVDIDDLKNILLSIDNISVCEKISNIKYSMRHKYIVVSIILIIIILFVLGNKNNVWFVIGYSLFWFAVFAYVSMSGILKFRVFICFLLPFLFLLILESNSLSINNKKIRVLLSCGMIFVFTSFWLVRTNNIRVASKEDRSLSMKNYAIVSQSIDDYMYVVPSGGLVIQHINPFVIDKCCFRGRIRGLGWLTKIPFNKGILESHKDLVDNDICLIVREDFDFEKLQTAIYENYNINTKIDTICMAENCLAVKLRENKIPIE